MTTAEPAPGGPPPPPFRRRRLGSFRNVKGAMADVYHRLDSGELDVKKANAMTYTLSSIAAVIEKEINAVQLAEIQAQLDALKAEGLLR